MVAVKCESGKHIWESTQKEELEKCCNGYTLMWEPWGNEATAGYNRWGDWFGAPILVKDDDQKEIARIKYLQAMERQASRPGAWIFTKQ
jgi:hypothetical protein